MISSYSICETGRGGRSSGLMSASITVSSYVFLKRIERRADRTVAVR